MKYKHTFYRLFILTAVLATTLLLPTPTTGAQTPLATHPYAAQAQTIFEQMSVAQRIGQLFLVTFPEHTVTPDSDIYDLILNYHIGGVVLRQENNNFPPPPDAQHTITTFLTELQTLSLQGSVPISNTNEPITAALPDTTQPAPIGIPLFIAVNDWVNNPPQGFTPLPSNMAIGATWNRTNAYNVGAIAGAELAAIGVNMFMGPALDVLEDPSVFTSNALATQAFGSDPYWVGQMGQQYTAGLHVGSNGRLAVIASHFPGYGSSDRPLHEEIPTIRKSLAELQQIELVPFMAVTNHPVTATQRVDGLLSTHIRYQGFESNLRSITNPITFDAEAFTKLLSLPIFAQWRRDGGLVVSDSLGTYAVKRYYDEISGTFSARTLATSALFAGNDLLYVADFAALGAPPEASLANIKETMAWFQTRYDTDTAFQQAVDTAVLRILQNKLSLYEGSFDLETVIPSPNPDLPSRATTDATLLTIAQQAATLIAARETSTTPNAPGPNDTITIFTANQLQTHCAQCPPTPLIGTNTLADQIITRYGPLGSGQIKTENIFSFNIDQLGQYLNASPDQLIPPANTTTSLPSDLTPTPGTTPTPLPPPPPSIPYQIQETLRRSNTILFALLDGADANTSITLIKQFLAQRPDITRDAKIIVFTYGAPYYLDTTEISQLTAYYAFYSHQDAFIDASLKTLFQEFPPSGAAPVDIPGINYRIFEATQPNPDRPLELYIVTNEGELVVPTSEENLQIAPGATLQIQTGLILDRNRNHVPDGTIVQFLLRDQNDNIIKILDNVPTQNGIAQLEFDPNAHQKEGLLRITAQSAPVTNSGTINITAAGNAAIETPIPQPTATPNPTTTPSPTPMATHTPTITPSPTPAITPTPLAPPSTEPTLQISLSAGQMLFTLISSLSLFSLIMRLLIVPNLTLRIEHKVSIWFWGIITCLITYNILQLAFPALPFRQSWPHLSILITTTLAGFIGPLLYWILHPSSSAPSKNNEDMVHLEHKFVPPKGD